MGGCDKTELGKIPCISLSCWQRNCTEQIFCWHSSTVGTETFAHGVPWQCLLGSCCGKGMTPSACTTIGSNPAASHSAVYRKPSAHVKLPYKELGPWSIKVSISNLVARGLPGSYRGCFHLLLCYCCVIVIIQNQICLFGQNNPAEEVDCCYCVIIAHYPTMCRCSFNSPNQTPPGLNKNRCRVSHKQGIFWRKTPVCPDHGSLV